MSNVTVKIDNKNKTLTITKGGAAVVLEEDDLNNLVAELYKEQLRAALANLEDGGSDGR